MSIRLAPLFLLLAVLMRPCWAAGEAPDLAAADALIRGGKAAQAWSLLEPHEFDAAGNPEYDYLLGIAALDSGRPDRATFILERVIGVNPNHAAARLDMARALFALDDLERAKGEFEATLRLDPPHAARLTIERYLAAIAERRAATKVRASAYAEAGIGTDSNLNAGVSGGSYFIPIFGANFNSASRRADYGHVAIGGEAAVANNQGGELFAGADIKRRHQAYEAVDGTRNTDYYDTRSFDVRLGAQQKVGAADALRLTAARSKQALDDTSGYRSTQSLLAEWRHSFDGATQGSAWLLDQRNRYGTVAGTSYRQYGGDQLLLGLGLVHAFGAEGRFVLHGSGYGGEERATDRGAGNLDGDKRIGGLRVGGLYRVADDLDLTAGAGALYNRYELVNPMFRAQRVDFLWDASLGAQWRFARDWTLKPQYAYTRSDANFGAYDYERHDFSLTLRYDLR